MKDINYVEVQGVVEGKYVAKNSVFFSLRVGEYNPRFIVLDRGLLEIMENVQNGDFLKAQGRIQVRTIPSKGGGRDFQEGIFCTSLEKVDNALEHVKGVPEDMKVAYPNGFQNMFVFLGTVESFFEPFDRLKILNIRLVEDGEFNGFGISFMDEMKSSLSVIREGDRVLVTGYLSPQNNEGRNKLYFTATDIDLVRGGPGSEKEAEAQPEEEEDDWDSEVHETKII